MVKVEDGYWVTVIDYKRVGLFEFERGTTVNGVEKPIDFTQINAKISNKNLDEVKQIAQKQDLSIQEYTPEKSEIEKEYEEEQKKPKECQKLLQLENFKAKINDYSFLYKNMTYREHGKVLQEKKLNTGSVGYSGKPEKYYVEERRVDGESDKNIIKIKLVWNPQPTEENDYSSNLVGFYKVYNDCREEEIPLPEKPVN